MIPSRVSNNENLETDVVVIGGGGTGLAAAVAAAEKGARVVVLEKANAPGGNSARAVGFFAAESAAQKRLRIDAPRDVLFKMAMDYAHWRIDPRVMRAFIDKSADTVRWLEEKGLEIDKIPSFYPNQVIRTEHDAKKDNRSTKILAGKCDELGVQVLCQTPAKHILMTSKGKVEGVLAEADGKEIKISAQCVIIGTGGYGANTELLKKYSPWYTEEIPYRGSPLMMGDGLLMALEIGAATAGLGQLRMKGPDYQGSQGTSKRVALVYNQPNTIWVNKKGQRFTDEGLAFNHFESTNAVLQQPGRVSYTLLDEQIKRTTIENEPIRVAQEGYYGPEGNDWRDIEKDLQQEADKGAIMISNSWDQIAKWIGANPQVLKTTIDEYNLCCDRGHDDIFAKDRRYLLPLRTPPYYALSGRLMVLTTQGGIKINYLMEVLDSHDDPIPGLYAGGDTTGGWEPETYNVHLSGSGLGFALNSGRIAGENAAKYVLEK